MSKYSEYYQLLGIQPGDSWAKIRIAYKAQMKKWHPDRYTDNEDSVRRAEEITKQLNQAYQEIQHYFELNGRLPLEREPCRLFTGITSVLLRQPHHLLKLRNRSNRIMWRIDRLQIKRQYEIWLLQFLFCWLLQSGYSNL
jgi:hypothetical protein